MGQESLISWRAKAEKGSEVIDLTARGEETQRNGVGARFCRTDRGGDGQRTDQGTFWTFYFFMVLAVKSDKGG